MATKQGIRREAQSVQEVKKTVKRPVKKRDVVLTPELHEAVLESIQQVQEGKVLSQEEVKRRNGL